MSDVPFALTRRTLLEGSAATALLAGTSLPALALEGAVSVPGVPMLPVTLTVNGTAHLLELDVRTTLLDALRETLRLTGTKKGRDHGQCGACTVLVNGRRINACLSLAALHEGDEIVTIEGIGTTEEPAPMQAAFVRHDAFQCGYCTSGQILSATALVDEVRAGWPSHVSADLAHVVLDDAEIRERMSGNLCRCAAYAGILGAIRDVAGRS